MKIKTTDGPIGFTESIGFDCRNPDCSISVFVAPKDTVSVKWIRDKGEDYIELQATCPCCLTRAWRYCDDPIPYKSLMNCMLEDMFKDIDPNLPKGV